MCEPLSAERIPLCGRSLCLGQLCLGHRAKLTNAGVGSPGREVKIAEECGWKIGGRSVCRSRRGQTNHSRALRVVARVVRRAGLLPVRRWSAEALVFGGRHNDPAGVRALADRGVDRGEGDVTQGRRTHGCRTHNSPRLPCERPQVCIRYRGCVGGQRYSQYGSNRTA